MFTYHAHEASMQTSQNLTSRTESYALHTKLNQFYHEFVYIHAN